MRLPLVGVTAACALLTALLTGCSVSSGNAVAAPTAIEVTTSPSPTATPSTTPSSAPTPKVTPTVAPTPTVTAAPARPVAKPAQDGDVDGDGRSDHVTFQPGGDPATWLVKVAMTTLGPRTGQVHTDGSPPTLAGVVDADGDGFAEVFVITAQGASTTFYTPLRLVGGVLHEVTLGGQPAQLGAGGTVLHGDGFSCRDTVRDNPGRELVVTSGSSEDGTTWHGRVTTYRWAGGSLVPLGQHDESFPVSGNEQRAASYSSVSCGSLSG